MQLEQLLSEILGILDRRVCLDELAHLIQGGIFVPEGVAVDFDRILHALLGPIRVGIGLEQVREGLEGGEKLLLVVGLKGPDPVAGFVDPAPIVESVQLPDGFLGDRLNDIPVVEVHGSFVVPDILVGDDRHAEHGFPGEEMFGEPVDELLVERKCSPKIPASVFLVCFFEKDLGRGQFRLGSLVGLSEPGIRVCPTPGFVELEGFLVIVACPVGIVGPELGGVARHLPSQDGPCPVLFRFLLPLLEGNGRGGHEMGGKCGQGGELVHRRILVLELFGKKFAGQDRRDAESQSVSRVFQEIPVT